MALVADKLGRASILTAEALTKGSRDITRTSCSGAASTALTD